MPWEQSFIVEGRFLGTAQRTFGSIHADKPVGYSYFCPTCGSLWAVCPIAGRPFHVLTRGCRKHGDIRHDGSIWLGWDKDFTEAFPPDALLDELKWLLTHVYLSDQEVELT